MSVADILDLHPDCGDILALYGLHCIGCAFSGSDTLEDGALLHGLSDDDIDNILIDLNDVLKTGSGASAPITITLTEPAANALKELVKQTFSPPYTLRIHIDEEQKFFLEPITTPLPDDHIVTHPLVPDLSIAIEDALAKRIRGGTIDYREGRLKLDLLTERCCQKKREDVL